MVHLLIADPAPSPLKPDHRFGGLPVVPKGMDFAWPFCKTCSGAMQYLGRLRIPGEEKLVLLFMCQNDPGLCDEWDADEGGNCAIVVQAIGLSVVQPPHEGVTVLQTEYGAQEVESAKDEYDAAREAWSKETGHKIRDIVGQILGQPTWVQADETPTCNACGKPMRFLAQLEQGPEWQTEMNFGGGCAYVFDCACNPHSAKFLWQC